MVWIEAIEAEEPRVSLVGPNEIDGLLGAPGGLVILGRRTGVDVGRYLAPVDLVPGLALFLQPLGVGVFLPVGLRVVRPMEVMVAVVGSILHLAVRTGGQVQLAGQAAAVAGIREELAHQDFVGRYALPVLPAAGGPRVAPGEKGRPARGADGALAKGIVEGNAFPDEAVEVRGAGMRVAQGIYCVVALLVRADPQYVWR